MKESPDVAAKKEVSTASETRAEEMDTANKDRWLTALFAKWSQFRVNIHL